MEKLFSDKNTYKQYKCNHLNKIRTKISKQLNHLNNHNFLKTKFHKNALTLTNTQLSRGYGLPKIHKRNTPFRPIISCINIPNNFLAYILLNELKYLIKPPTHTLKNSQELINKVIYTRKLCPYVFGCRITFYKRFL